MKAYMGYSQISGQSEAAVLIFANNIREAKKIGWDSILCDICDNEYIDIGITQMKNSPWLFEEMKSNKPHVIEDPESCNECGLWGYELTDRVCENCRE